MLSAPQDVTEPPAAWGFDVSGHPGVALGDSALGRRYRDRVPVHGIPSGRRGSGRRSDRADSDAAPYPERESLPGWILPPPARDTQNLHVLRIGAGPHRLQVLKARAGRAALPATAPTPPPPDRTCRRGDGGGGRMPAGHTTTHASGPRLPRSPARGAAMCRAPLCGDGVRGEGRNGGGRSGGELRPTGGRVIATQEGRSAARIGRSACGGFQDADAGRPPFLPGIGYSFFAPKT